jgi:acyl transferase domain-containing protein
MGSHVWKSELDRRDLPYLNDHRIQGTTVVPVSVYVEMAQAATREAFGMKPFVLKEIAFKKALFLPDEGCQMVQIILSPDGDEETSFSVYSSPGKVPQKSWILHATGKIRHT